MSTPTMTSYITQTSSSTTSTVDLSAVAIGSWMLAVFEIGMSNPTITAPSGWTALLPVSTPQVFGTRTFGVYGRIKQSGDTTFSWILGTGSTNRLSVMWGAGGDVVTNWKVGTTGVRNAGNAVASQSVLAGTSTTSVSPAITTSVDNCLVLAMNMEATLATETGPSSYSGGTEWFWSTTTGTYIESLHVLYNAQATAGTVGAVTTTYPNAQVSNGAGLQIAIPLAAGIAQDTPIFTGPVAETIFNLTGTGPLTYSITMPSGITVGDYIMVFMRLQSPAIVAQPSIPGFSLVGRVQPLSGAGTRYNAIFGLPVITSGDIPGSTVTVTINQSVAGSNRAVAEAFRVSNVDLTNPIVSTAGAPTSGPTTTRPAYTSIVNALDIFYAGSEFSASNDHIPTSYPSGYTAVITGGGVNPIGGSLTASRTYMYLGIQTTTSTSLPSAAITWGTPAGPDAEGISIRGKNAVTAPSGIALKDGNGNPIYLTYLDATLTRVAPNTVKQWLPGYPTVTSLLADISRHPTMAHRGGSANYPEFSEYGYDHSVMNGTGVLEFSCGWTSDLVPFGLAAQYLDTAAGLTAGTNLDPTTITWATLSSTYVNKLLPVAPGVYQPFFRLADFLAKYTPTHIVCVDPKFGFANSTKVNAMLNICDANGGPSKIIIKFDSPVTDTTLTSAAHARGYKCMNYWNTDITSLNSQQANWDILGYAYNGSSTDWTTIKSYGKPTWAAVIPDAAGVATATASGADLMMIKDVVNIAPISYWNQ